MSAFSEKTRERRTCDVDTSRQTQRFKFRTAARQDVDVSVSERNAVLTMNYAQIALCDKYPFQLSRCTNVIDAKAFNAFDLSQKCDENFGLVTIKKAEIEIFKVLKGIRF